MAGGSLILGLPLLWRASSTITFAKAVALQSCAGVAGFGTHRPCATITGMPQYQPSPRTGTLLARYMSSHTAMKRMSRGRQMAASNMFIGSPGELIQPYLPPLQHPSLFSRQGLISRWRALKSSILNILSRSYLKLTLKQVSGEKWTPRTFLNLASKMYSDVNTCIAKGDVNHLRGLVTENMLTKLDNDLGLSKRVGPPFHWSCEMKPPKLVIVRFARTPMGSKYLDFAQITVQYTGTQTLTSPNQEVMKSEISEYWVYERALQQREAKWRLCHQASPQ